MPPGTTPFGLRTALRTGRTDTTRRLERILADPTRRAAISGYLSANGAVHRANGSAWAPGPVGGPAIGWARQQLQDPALPSPLTGEEVEHIQAWPEELKELVRIALVDAIANGRNVAFRWELHDGNTEATAIVTTPAAGDMTITFLSPWAGVRIRPAQGDLHVDVETFPDGH